MKSFGNHLKDPLNMILVILVAVSLLGAWLYVKSMPGLDYYVAWAAADAIKNEKTENIYQSDARYKLAVIYRNKADEQQDAPRQKLVAKNRSKHLDMTATPFMYWVTGLLSTGDYENDLTTWQTLSLFLVAFSILLICRTLNYPLATSLVILLPIIMTMAPLHSDLRVANVNSIQLGMIALILWLQKRSAGNRFLFATGLVIGLLGMFKPNLAPIALLFAGGWAVRRKYSKLLVTLSGIATGAISALLVSSWWMGKATIWWDWWQIIGRTMSGGTPGRSAGNYSPVVQASGGIDMNNQFVLALLYCLLCLAAYWWGRRKASVTSQAATAEREMLENTALIAIGCIVALLASSLVWLHYYLLVIPMVLFALRPWSSSCPMNPLTLLMSRFLPVLALFCLLETEIRTVLDGVVSGGTYWAWATATSSISLFVVGLWQLVYGIRGRESK